MNPIYEAKGTDRRLVWWLVPILAVSFVLNVYNIWQDGLSNTYYAATVKSMMTSFHNFFYASYDPAGFITVDKPPVALWVQTIFAQLFGYKGWILILPQSLAGVASVALLYAIVKPRFGRGTALLAALILALSPIAVAVSRTNNVDTLLVFTLLAGTWALFKSIRERRIDWLLAAAALVGIGFNIKMLQAFMVVPAFYLIYALSAPVGWRAKLGHLTGATAVLIAVSISWAVVVDTIPADKRPYIGSSKTNSVLELAFGYNGVSRLTGEGGPGQMMGQGGMPGGGMMQGGFAPPGGQGDGGVAPQGQGRVEQGDRGGRAGSMPALDLKQMEEMRAMMEEQGFAPPNGGGMPAGGPGGMSTGKAGVFRLFSPQLGGQIGWLLAFALFAAIGLFAGVRQLRDFTERHKETLFWYAWLIPMSVFFSIASFMHQYYLTMMAPAIAALTAIGAAVLWRRYREAGNWTRWLLPAGVLLTGMVQAKLLSDSSLDGMWAAAAAAAGVILALVLWGISGRSIQWRRGAAVLSLAAFLAAPFYWSMTPALYGDSSVLPEAGPQLNRSSGMMDMLNGQSDPGLIRYLENHNKGEKYLVATASNMSATPIQLATDKAVMMYGGYLGSDPALNVEKLEQMVSRGEVRYFLLSPMGGQNEVEQWIRDNCKEVPTSEWQTSGGGTGGAGGFPMMRGMNSLYEYVG